MTFFDKIMTNTVEHVSNFFKRRRTMKPLYTKISIILCTLFLWAGMSVADVIHIGTFSGNDNDANHVSSLVNYYHEPNTDLPVQLTLLGKWESEDGKWESWDNTKGPKFYGSFLTGGTRDESGIISGNWDAGEDWSASDPIYYSFKASNDFALYYANGETSGNWTIDWTAGNSGKSPDLSHISFWTAEGNTNPVPEPGTLALVGLGLAGIAGYRRKRHSS